MESQENPVREATLTTELSGETCTLDGCERELNRDGVCFYHKMKTIRFGSAAFTQERKGQGWGINPNAGTAENVRAMYEQRRKDGQPDPIPDNKAAAKFAPAAGVARAKNYKEINNGL